MATEFLDEILDTSDSGVITEPVRQSALSVIKSLGQGGLVTYSSPLPALPREI